MAWVFYLDLLCAGSLSLERSTPAISIQIDLGSHAVIAYKFLRHRQATVDEMVPELKVRARSRSFQTYCDEGQRRFKEDLRLHAAILSSSERQNESHLRSPVPFMRRYETRSTITTSNRGMGVDAPHPRATVKSPNDNPSVLSGYTLAILRKKPHGK